MIRVAKPLNSIPPGLKYLHGWQMITPIRFYFRIKETDEKMKPVWSAKLLYKEHRKADLPPAAAENSCASGLCTHELHEGRLCARQQCLLSGQVPSLCLKGCSEDVGTGLSRRLNMLTYDMLRMASMSVPKGVAC